MEVAQESQSKSSEMVHTQSTDQVHPLIKALVTKELDGILREMESLPQRLKTSLIGRLATRLLMIQKDDGLPQHHIMLVDPPPKPFRKMSKRELEEVFLCDVCRTAVHEAVDQMVLDMEWRQKSEMKSKRYKVAYASAVEEAHRQAIAALLLVDESERQEAEGVVGMLEDFLNPKTLFDRVRFSRNLRALSKTSVLKKNEPLTRSLLAVNNASRDREPHLQGAEVRSRKGGGAHFADSNQLFVVWADM